MKLHLTFHDRSVYQGVNIYPKDFTEMAQLQISANAGAMLNLILVYQFF